MYTLENGYLNAGVSSSRSLCSGRSSSGGFSAGGAAISWPCRTSAPRCCRRVGIRPKPFRSRLLVFVPGLVAAYMFLWRPWRAVAMAGPASRPGGSRII